MHRLAIAAALALGLSWAPAGTEAATIDGTGRPDRLVGTSGPDVIRGRAGDDRIEGRAGDDLLTAGTGSDRVRGETGNDRIAVQGDGFDSVDCGPGTDVVNADRADAVAADCEVVSRQFSRDRYSNDEAQHETQVEPDSFSSGKTIVTTFQVGRYFTGGATDIGFATSRDAGRSWRSGSLPGVSVHSRPAGASGRVTDPAVAYDAAHRTWLIVSLGGAEGVAPDGDDRLLVSRSPNGVTWARPVTAARAREAYDKPWISCDNWSGSRFRGRCYLTYLDVRSGLITVIHSTDGGRTWSSPAGIPTSRPTNFRNGAVPLALANGTLAVLFSSFAPIPSPDEDYVGVARSLDGGVTFLPEGVVSSVGQSVVFNLRTVSFVSAETDAAGRIYAVWQECRFWACDGSEIVLSSSSDAVSWTEPSIVPTAPGENGTDFFLPAVGVDPVRRGATARLTVAYHSLASCEPSFCPGVGVAAVSSANGGATWSSPERLESEAMPLSWIADSSLGHMLGDYISVSYTGDRAIPVFALASEPVAGAFRQSIVATTRGVP